MFFLIIQWVSFLFIACFLSIPAKASQNLLNNYNTRISMLEESFAQKSQEVSALKQNLSTKQQEINYLKNELSIRTTEAQKSISQLISSQTENSKLQQVLEEHKKFDLEKYKSLITTSNLENKRIKQTFEAKEEDWKKNIQEKENEINTLQQTLVSLEHVQEQIKAEYQSVFNKLEEEKKQKENILKDKSSLFQEVNTLKQNLSKAEEAFIAKENLVEILSQEHGSQKQETMLEIILLKEKLNHEGNLKEQNMQLQEQNNTLTKKQQKNMLNIKNIKEVFNTINISNSDSGESGSSISDEINKIVRMAPKMVQAVTIQRIQIEDQAKKIEDLETKIAEIINKPNTYGYEKNIELEQVGRSLHPPRRSEEAGYGCCGSKNSCIIF